MLLVAVVISGLVIGYWLVSAFLSSSPSDRQDPSGSQAPGDAPPPAGPPTRHWSDVLHVSLDADATTITRAYRHAIDELTPQPGARQMPDDEERTRFALAEIEAAYRQAMRDLQR